MVVKAPFYALRPPPLYALCDTFPVALRNSGCACKYSLSRWIFSTGMSSWTLVAPRLNSIDTHARLWAGDVEATHPKNRSSSMTSVTGSPTGKPAPAHARASCAANIIVPSIVAHRVVVGCDVPVREGPHWRHFLGRIVLVMYDLKRTIEACKSLMFHDSLVVCCFKKAPMRQTPSWGGHP